MRLLLIVGKEPPVDPDADKYQISAISVADFWLRGAANIAETYRFVLVHRGDDDGAMARPGGRPISVVLSETMPGRVAFVSAGGIRRRSDRGLPMLGQISTADDLVHAARQSALVPSFEGTAEDLLDLLSQEASEWEAILAASGILIQGIWAVWVADARVGLSTLSPQLADYCKQLGFSPRLELPAWTQGDRMNLVQRFVAMTYRLSNQPVTGREEIVGPDLTLAIKKITEQIQNHPDNWVSADLADLLVEATDGIARLCRKHLR